MAKVLKDLFEDDELYNNYESVWSSALDLLSGCKKLYEIQNFMDLDMSLEQTHEAKISIDYAINLLERLQVNKITELKYLKEDIKYERLRLELSFDSANQKLRDDSTAKDYEKRRERRVSVEMKEKSDRILELETDLEIIKMELKNSERTRENISDVYMSIKKKYDAITRHISI